MKNETENKSNLEIFDMYLADELVLDERVFQVPGVRLEKCIYLLEKELTTLYNDEVEVCRVVGYLCIPIDKRIKNNNLKYRHYKFLACILSPVIVCKAIAKVYKLDYDTLWTLIAPIVEDDVIFQVDESYADEE